MRKPSTMQPVLRHLAKADPVMRKLIRRAGPCTLTPRRREPLYQTLVRAIAHQQLNGRAANAILARFIALFPGKRFPDPDDIRLASVRSLRGAGFSRAKRSCIKRWTLTGAGAAGIVGHHAARALAFGGTPRARHDVRDVRDRRRARPSARRPRGRGGPHRGWGHDRCADRRSCGARPLHRHRRPRGSPPRHGGNARRRGGATAQPGTGGRSTREPRARCGRA